MSCLSKQQIIKYLENSLPLKDKGELEDHLQSCPLCRSATNGFVDHYNFSSDHELDQLEQTLFSSHNSVRPHRSLGNLAAAVILILLTSFAIFNYWNSSIEERLYAAYYTPFTVDDIMRGEISDEQHSSELKQALQYYNHRDFEESLPHFTAHLEDFPEHDHAKFLLGLTLLELGQPEQAIDQLNTVRINNPYYYEDATWYLMLGYLRAGKHEMSKALLEDLLQVKNGYYHEAVIELKKKLN